MKILIYKTTLFGKSTFYTPTFLPIVRICKPKKSKQNKTKFKKKTKDFKFNGKFQHTDVYFFYEPTPNYT